VRKTTLGICLVVVVAGCRGDNRKEANASTDTMPRREAAAPRGPVVLADPQISQVLMSANSVEVALGELARQRASDDEVRNFAQTMVADHGAIYRQQAALNQQLNLAPSPHPLSEQVAANAEQTRQALDRLSGEQFDRVYMANEIVMHQNLLDSLQVVLVPRTQNPQLKEFLEKLRATVVAHLRMARSIERRINPRVVE